MDGACNEASKSPLDAQTAAVGTTLGGKPATGTENASRDPSAGPDPLNVSQLRERSRRKRHVIKKLEKKLEVLHRQIKKFSEAEVSLEEMDSGTSAYMKEDLLKRKFMATWQELCNIVGISSEIEITSEELTTGYTKTPYPEINRRVTRLLRCNEFPDHYDIVELIERCNTKHELGISVEEKAQLSREVFKDVGKILKAQRARDFKAHFGSHLTDDVLKRSEDPAASDSALLDTLRQSLKQGQERLEQLCEGFVVKQEMESEQDKSGEGDPCESEEDEEEEEEIEGEGEEEDGGGVEEEGQDDDGTSTGMIKSDNAISNKPCDEVSGGVTIDCSDVDDIEAANTQSSDDESDKATPTEPAPTDSSPNTSAGEEDEPSITAQSHNSDSSDSSDAPPQSKRIKLTHTKANGTVDSERDGDSSSACTTVESKSRVTPKQPVILVDSDDDSDTDVIVLSD